MTAATAPTPPQASPARAPLALGRPRFRHTAKGTATGPARGSAPAGGGGLFGGTAHPANQRDFGFYGAVPRLLRRCLLEQRTPLGTLPLARNGRSSVEQAKVALHHRMEMYSPLPRLDPRQVFTANFLPDGILAKKKQGFGFPFGVRANRRQ